MGNCLYSPGKIKRIGADGIIYHDHSKYIDRNVHDVYNILIQKHRGYKIISVADVVNPPTITRKSIYIFYKVSTQLVTTVSICS